MSWWEDVAQALEPGFLLATHDPAWDAENQGTEAAIASSTGFMGSITAFLEALADWRMWASLGWILLGLALVIAGAMLWLKKSAGVLGELA